MLDDWINGVFIVYNHQPNKLAKKERETQENNRNSIFSFKKCPKNGLWLPVFMRSIRFKRFLVFFLLIFEIKMSSWTRVQCTVYVGPLNWLSRQNVSMKIFRKYVKYDRKSSIQMWLTWIVRKFVYFLLLFLRDTLSLLVYLVVCVFSYYNQLTKGTFHTQHIQHIFLPIKRPRLMSMSIVHSG